MKIETVARQEVGILGSKGSTVGLQNVSDHFAQVEGARQQIVLILRTQHIRIQPHEPTGCRRAAMMGEHRHDRSRAGMAGQVTVFSAVHSAVDRMEDSVSQTVTRLDHERGGQDPLTAGSKYDFDRVVHTAGHDVFDQAA